MAEGFQLGLDEIDGYGAYRAFHLLKEGVPLTLLLDLATPLHSAELYESEAGKADWLQVGVA